MNNPKSILFLQPLVCLFHFVCVAFVIRIHFSFRSVLNCFCLQKEKKAMRKTIGKTAPMERKTLNSSNLHGNFFSLSFFFAVAV